MPLVLDRHRKNESADIGPVLKWAGGKRQLLPVLLERLDQALTSRQVNTYIEPFFGGGALFFELMKEAKFDRWILVDNNPELIVVYRSLQKDAEAVMGYLEKLSEDYLPREQANRDLLYYQIREEFNEALHNFNFESFNASWPKRAAQMIFLNKTCFNGLFRVNQKGFFNVPTGRYKNPKILDVPRLQAASSALQQAELLFGDFTQILSAASEDAFIYYDPPYRPISKTSAFTAYTAGSFDDDEQRRLAELFKEADRKGALQLLSNSDPTNYVADPFFDDLYKNFIIERVKANRFINSKASNRGPVRELLIRNYD